ncbi:hypothetical protein M9X92_012163 [Pyricularia oryzae]|nr:hypothetical protein M9X92_012163 [Pyricularia oryzae]
MELETSSKVYCHDPKCSTFVPPRGRSMPGIAPRIPASSRCWNWRFRRAGSGATTASVSSNLELAAIT